jgi:thiosulfate/3-mercaptopyruvate sulfurtransferase
MQLKIFAPILASAMAVAAPHPEMLVSTDWLAQHLSDPKLAILHVAANRTAYDAGHIPGARFVLLGDLAITRNGVPNELPPDADLKRVLEAAGVSDDTRVIVYGDTSVLPATRAFFTLDYLGHASHALLDGGLGKWNAEGRTITKDAPSAGAGHLTPHPKPELVLQFDQISALAKRPDAEAKSPALLDVRPAGDFSGERGSHIPTAINASWVDSQLSAQNQTLKPADELRRMYEQFGIKSDVPVITYCNSGMQASQSYFTLKYLGYDVKMYDGSMSEWNLKGGPVQK